MSVALIDPIAQKFQFWVTECREPTTTDIEAWTHLVLAYAPRPLTVAELNRAGRKAWGDSWYDLSTDPSKPGDPF